MRLTLRTGRRRTAVLAAVVLTPFTLSAVPARAATPVRDDTPVRVAPKAVHVENEDGSFDKLRDAFYDSRLFAGDNGGIDPATASQLRASAAAGVDQLSARATVAGAPSGTWASQGPDPTVQLGRTSSTFEAVSGRITSLVVRPDGTVVAGAAQGGVWTYDQATRVWTSRSGDTDTQSVGALAAAPSRPRTMYLGTGEGDLSGDSYFGNGVFRSDDGGVSWAKVSGSTFVGVSTSSVVVDPTDPEHLYVATLRGVSGSPDVRTVTGPAKTYGVYESKDGGRTWLLRKGTTDQLHGATALVMDPQDPRLLLASFWADGIYKSVDGGLNWAPAMTGLPAGDYAEGGTRFALGISHPAGIAKAVVYTGFDWFESNGTHHAAQVWKSTNAGDTWAATPTGSGIDSVLDYCGTQCFYDNTIGVDPKDPALVYVLGVYGYANSPQSGGVYRSRDGGRTWKSLGYDLHPDYHAIAFQPGDSAHVAIGNDGGVWQSSTGGGRNGAADPLSAASWENLNGEVDPQTASLVRSTGLRIGQFTSIGTVPQVPGQYWGGTQDNGTQRKSLSNGRFFDQSNGDGGNVIVDRSTANPLTPTLPAYVFGSYYAISPYRFDPAGTGTFYGNQTIDNGIDLSDRSEFYVPWVQDRGRVNELLLGTYRVYRTLNAEAAAPGDVTWAPISGDLTGGCANRNAPNGAACLISALGVADGGDGLYVGTEDGYVWASPNAATATAPSFTRVGKGTLPARPVSQFAVDRSDWRTAYAAYSGYGAATPRQRGHVYRTTDGGTTWTDRSAGLPDVPVEQVAMDPATPSTLYAGTDLGVYVTTDGGGSWARLGRGLPKTAVFGLDYDAVNGVLAAGTHGRGVYTLTDPAPAPALVVRTADSGTPIGPGSTAGFTTIVRNVGGARASGITVTVPLPAGTTASGISDGGKVVGGKIVWTGLAVGRAEGLMSVTYSLKVPSSAAGPLTVDGVTVTSAEGAATHGSPHTVFFAPAHAASSSGDQTGAARVGSGARYTVTVTNNGYRPDSYRVAASGPWATTVRDGSCTTALTTTPVVAPGATTALCVTVAVPAGAANAARKDSVLTVTSVASGTAAATATLTTIAVSADVLVVDGDGSRAGNPASPDVRAAYTGALDAAGVPYSYWDLSADPVIPTSLLTSHKKVVAFTGTSYPGPLTPYEAQLTTFLNGGGRLFLSGQDVLDQAAGTTTFVRTYLHVAWDGTETQNDRVTGSVTGVAASPLTSGLGKVPLDHSVLGAPYEDQVTPIAPATRAFTDDTGAADALSVTTGGYKVVFLAFPFEEYGAAADRATLMRRVLSYLG